MSKRTLFHRSLLLIGLGLALTIVLIGLRLPVRLGASALPATPQATSTATPVQIDLSTTRWRSFEDEPLLTYDEWKAMQLPASLYVERLYSSATLSGDATSDQVVCATVNPAIYGGISASLAQWILDVESEGWNVVVYSASFPDPSALRDYLASIAGLRGCLLIGDFPVPWYELDDKQFPMDVYYMDLDGVWHDGDLDGLYEDQTGDVAPEIWIGRLMAGNLTFGGDEVSLLNNYFRRNHAYRTGDLVLPARALVYLDDDWAYAADGMRQTMSLLYPNTTVISDSYTTRSADYGQRLVDYYAWVHVFAHSTPSWHSFTYDEGGTLYSSPIYNDSIYHIDPHTFFYNLFACAAARFVEHDYLAGWYIFADSYGLAALGSTSGGSMVRGFDLFHEPLAQGKPLGEAYWEWFSAEGVEDRSWHYGLTLLGDPTLTVKTEDLAIEAPTSVTIGGPTGGEVQASHTFTGTVGPATATQPIMYIWEATGQLPVTHKSGLSDTATFTWPNAPGTKAITVTARSFGGSVGSTHTITVEVPEITVTPSQMYETLVLGMVSTRSLEISNEGPGGLHYSLAEADHSSTLGSGPDLFGYTYKDSNDADGPTYQWIEIAPPAGGSGTEIAALTGVAREHFWPIPLPFSFNFYGMDYADLGVVANGLLTFMDQYISWENGPIPSPREYKLARFLAPFWDYLIIDPGAIFCQALDSMFVIEFYQVSRLGGANPGTWEIVLFQNGNILFQYQDASFGYYWGDYGRGATVGIQGDAITGLQYSYRSAALSDGLAICFAYPGQMPDCSGYGDTPWLSQDPIGGRVAPGSVQSVDLVFDARVPPVMQPGDYQTMLIIANSDLDESLIVVPVTMNVLTPTFGLELAPEMESGSGDTGTTVTYTLRVTNTGDTFDTFDVAVGGFAWPVTVPAPLGPLGPGSGQDLLVSVQIPPGTLGGASDTATLTVTSHGDDAQWAMATLTTTARSLPGLAVSKHTSTDRVWDGEQLTYILCITNTGNVDLLVTVTDVLPSHVTPGGVLTWTATLPALDGSWTEMVVVTIDVGYAGPLTNVVWVTSQEGAADSYVETCTSINAHRIYVPSALRNYRAAISSGKSGWFGLRRHTVEPGF